MVNHNETLARSLTHASSLCRTLSRDRKELCKVIRSTTAMFQDRSLERRVERG